MITIQNEELTASISALGAELQSIKDARTGREYLWQADPQWWSGRSPILFPATGGLWNGTYRTADGKELPMAKHGFARRTEWKEGSITPTSASFVLEDSEKTRECYPFHFRLTVTYSLQGRTLKTEFTVENPDTEATLHFQLGAHPAIQLPDWDGKAESAVPDGYLRLTENPTYVVRAGEQGCWSDERFDFPKDERGLVPISVETFSNEALIFPHSQIASATVLDRSLNPVVRLRSTAPVWLFWQPQGKRSPFVCLEPWYGLCDQKGFTGMLSDRPFINSLPPTQTWVGGYELQIY